MKPARILIAAVAGGLVIFIWSAIVHTAPGISELGIKQLPNDQMIMPALRFSIHEGGFYRYPPRPQDKSEAATKAWEQKYQEGPRGTIIYDPPGPAPAFPRLLVTEFITDVVAAFLLALIIALSGGGAARGALIGTIAGVFATVSIDASYWNWDFFPARFALLSLIDQIGDGLGSGLLIGLILGKTRPSVNR